jgi:Cys-rich protein (TIGR01571 family)
MDYNIINKGEWITNLYDCDAESCFLSCVVPCHVYAKIKSLGKGKSHYCIHLFIYMFLYLSIQQLWYSIQYLESNECPAQLIDNCISLVDNCEDYYMMQDDVRSACLLKNNICVYDTHECLSHKMVSHTSLYFFIFTSIGYAGIVFLHYTIRQQIKLKQTIGGNALEDVIAVVCCPSCGLAQEYREL